MSHGRSQTNGKAGAYCEKAEALVEPPHVQCMLVLLSECEDSKKPTFRIGSRDVFYATRKLEYRPTSLAC